MSFIQPINKRVDLDREFTIKIPNGFEKTLDVYGSFDPDSLKLCLTSSISIPDPELKIVSKGEGFYTVKVFLKGYMITNSYRFVFYESKNNRILDAVEEKIVSELPKFLKTRKLARKILVTLAILVGSALVLFIDDKYNGGKINKVYSFISARTISSWFKSASDEIDTRILTNSHELYTSEGFLEKEEDLRDELGEYDFSLKKQMWFVGEVDGQELFVLRELFRMTDQKKPKIDTLEKAVEFCSKIDGQVPSREELDQALFGKATKIPDLAWKVKTENHYPEWTRDNIESDYYAIFMKKEMLPPINAKNIHGVIAGDEDESYASFRCVFYGDSYE